MTLPAPGGRRPAPIVVTGLPRSGTTWVAQQLARQPGTSLLGREPMNPRPGQWGLGGEVRGWTRWHQPPVRAAHRLRRAYAGRAPHTYGPLGSRQWSAPLPGTRVVVKDPFALLSLRAVVTVTRAVPVVVYRSPEAVLSSYRRMGWRPDLAELLTLGAQVPSGADDDDALGMAAFWSWAHACLLEDLADLEHAVVVSHAELTAGGAAAWQVLVARLGLGRAVPARAAHGPRADRVREGRLHNLDRTPEEVLSGGDHRVSDEERTLLHAETADVATRLDRVRLRLG